jgi:transcriptional regulator with XRE-family HTH domain
MPPPQPQLARLFSMRLARARLLRDLNQKELGREAGIPPNSIAQFETGARMPTIESLRRLGRALNVPTDYLLGLIDFPDLADTVDIIDQASNRSVSV